MAPYGNLESFCKGFGGEALRPGQPGYEKARAVWNGAIDRRPAVIASCRTAAQVADAIRHARDAGLEISVRSQAQAGPIRGLAKGQQGSHAGEGYSGDTSPQDLRAAS